MEQPSPRSKLALPLVAVGSFVLGLGCGIGIMAIALTGPPRVWSEFRQTPKQKVLADISQIKEALDSYAMNNAGEYPKALTPLVALDQNGHRYFGQSTIPKDPWGVEYGYEPPAPGYPQPRVFTLGKDKSIGGTGDDADIDYAAIVEGR